MLYIILCYIDYVIYSPTTIEVDTDTAIICDHFNGYFSNIAKDILKTNKPAVLKTFEKFLNNPLSNSFVFEPCDPGEVRLLINELNPSKASGPNGTHLYLNPVILVKLDY